MNEKELNDKMIEELEGILLSMKEQRDKPVTDVLTKEHWNRVIDERYLCKFWDESEDGGWRFDYLILRVDDKYFDAQDNVWEHCEPVRELGIKQPHFRGQPPPTELNSDRTLVYYEDGGVHQLSDSNHFNWDSIIAFIEV